MFTPEEKELIRQKARIAEEHLLNYNLRPFYGLPKDQLLIRISDAYPGVWLETAYGAVAFARLYPEQKNVARNMVEVFLNCQMKTASFLWRCWTVPTPKIPPSRRFSTSRFKKWSLSAWSVWKLTSWQVTTTYWCGCMMHLPAGMPGSAPTA